MINFDEQLEYFKLIGNTLTTRVVCYVLGGSAMMFYGAKTETKDVDLVFLEEEGLEEVKQVLYDSGFDEKQKLVQVFRRYEKARNTPVMMEGKNTRFDLFLREVITFKMSPTIIERAKECHEFGNLMMYLLSPEDIFLLKSATERDKDLVDALSLLQKFKLDWKIILGESVHQTTIGQYLFPVYLFDFLYALKENLKADVPKKVLDEVRKIAEDLLEEKVGKGRQKKGKHIAGKKKRKVH